MGWQATPSRPLIAFALGLPEATMHRGEESA